jgi:hypothetical protein
VEFVHENIDANITIKVENREHGLLKLIKKSSYGFVLKLKR